VLALSHTIGNDALSSVLSLREGGPATTTGILPAGPVTTIPAEWGAGELSTADAPDFAAFGPLGADAPMAL